MRKTTYKQRKFRREFKQATIEAIPAVFGIVAVGLVIFVINSIRMGGM